MSTTRVSSLPKLEKLPNFKRRHSEVNSGAESASKTNDNYKRNYEAQQFTLPPLTQTVSTPPTPFYDPKAHALLHMNSKLSSSKFDGRPNTPWHNISSRSSRSHSI